MKEAFYILVIVLIAAFAVIGFSSITGKAAYNAYSSYGVGAKVYGGGLRKAMANPGLVSKKFQEDQYIQRLQNYMLLNKKSWDCSFGAEAKDSIYPCMFDDKLQKYCCVIDNKPGNWNQIGKL